MIPVKTTVEDIQRVLTYLGKQIGWVEPPKIEKALGSVDDRKIGAMVEFGLIIRDGGNLRTTPRGQQFNSDPKTALRDVMSSVELYRETLEWVHYGNRAEVTTAEIGQYWEASHKDTIGGLSGATLASGAVTFGRIVDGAEIGTFVVGRGGKETRVTFDLAEVDLVANGAPNGSAESEIDEGVALEDAGTALAEAPSGATAPAIVQSLAAPTPAPADSPTVSLSTSPSVHVNVEIHIAADATADTVREIFKNMARYVLDKPVGDDGE